MSFFTDIKMAKSRVFPWSYSSLTSFEQCPRRYKLIKIDRVVREPQSKQMLWGNEVHKALELAVRDNVPLPESLSEYGDIVTSIKAAPGLKLVEQAFGINAQFQPTEFFGKDVWFRGKIDLAILQGDTANVFDYKTGKMKDDPTQLALFAGAAFVNYPAITTVNARFIWLKDDKTSGQQFRREEQHHIWQPIMLRLQKMQHADETDQFPPNPSGLCKKHCPVGRANCDYCGE